MARTLAPVIATITLALVVIGCSNSSIEDDAKKLADIQCRALKITQKVTSGDLSVIQESTKLQAEVVSLNSELKSKYTTREDAEAFSKAYLKAFGECK